MTIDGHVSQPIYVEGNTYLLIDKYPQSIIVANFPIQSLPKSLEMYTLLYGGSLL